MSCTRLPCWSHASWKICTKRTPRSSSRRASRQVLANDGLPGSAPYISRMCCGSWPMSITSGALGCMRKAISNELIRVAISGSPTSSSRSWLSLLDGVERVALELGVDAARVGEIQDRIAAGAELDALVDRRQKAAAPVGVAAAGPLLAGAEDDEAGQVLRLAAQAVATQAPMLGRPKICEPVFIKICPGAWLNASVTIDLTMAMSSTTVARCGSSSESSVPHWPCLANLNFGPSSFELGLMNAAR